MTRRRRYYWYCKHCHHAMPYSEKYDWTSDRLGERHKWSAGKCPITGTRVIFFRITFTQAMKWDKNFRKHGGFRAPR